LIEAKDGRNVTIRSTIR